MERKLLLKENATRRWAENRWSILTFVFMMLITGQNVLAQDTAPEAGEILGGPFAFCVDGTPDMVSGLSLEGDRVGSMSTWVITDDTGKILGLPPTLEAVEGVNFDGAGAGTCLIWYLRYEEGLEGLAPDLNANYLKGTFDLSNPVEVVRTATEGGTLTGGPYYFTVDGTPDMVSGIALTGMRAGTNSTWMITDEQGKILGLPPSLAAVEGVNFDGAGAGTCFIYHVRYEDGIVGLEADGNRDALEGCFDLSNAVKVVRTAAPHAGEIVGGPFAFCVDGTPDMVSGLSLEGDRVGSMSTWVITDDTGKILGLPPTLEAVEGVNFDGAGAGTCLIWYLRYEEGLEGLAPDLNANYLKGTFDLSNPVEVVRTATEGGTLTGGPYYFTVDGTPDMVSGIALTGMRAGTNSTWMITDEQGKILGLPPSLAAVEGVNFDGAGAGTCFIYHVRYEDGIVGLEADGNRDALEGCFDLSNAVKVVRTAAPHAGEIVGGPFAFCVDGTPDMVSGLSLEGDRVGSMSTWVITDDTGKILGLPPTLEAVEGVNFDGAGAGTCLIWYLRYEEGLEGLAPDLNANYLKGTFDLSNPVEVVRTATEGGTLTGGPYYFTVDGTPDMVSGIALTGMRAGTNSTWMITDEQGKILGLPPSLAAVEGVNFDGAGAGTCFIYHVRYEDGIVGLEADGNRDALEGCFDLSNAVKVVRTAAPHAGEIVGGPFAFCVDGTPDMVSGLSLEGDRVGSMSTWVITDDTGKILGLPPTLEAVEGVNFDGAGAGTCLIWYLRYEEGLEGLAPDLNANYLKGTFDLSNPVEVVRTATDGGTLTGGPFEFIVDGEVDNVYGIAITGNRSGSNSTFVVTSPEGEILGIPPSLAAVEGINFDGAGAGTCLIWHLRYEDGLEGLEMGLNTNDLNGCYDFSNYIEVVRKDAISGGMLSGGPSFEFCVGDEEADHVSGVTVSGNTGSNSRWVVTSPEGKILGLPPTPEAVNFDGAGAGTCLIWHLSHEDGLTGLEVGNYVADLYGTYDFSDYISVYRSQPDAGELTGGPFEFTVDGEVDNVYGIAITGNRSGSNSTFIVTSPEGEILGIPPSLAAVEGINFDGAGAGTCLIWHLRYEDGLEGLEMGLNTNDLNGCYDFSNYIEVVRKDAISGGMLSGGPSFEFCVGDEEADHVSGVTVSGNTGSNSRWVVTSPEGKILGLPPTPEAVNFDGAGAGTCLIWHLSHEDGLTGLEVGNYVADLYGTYDFSDYISVYRSQPDAGELTGGPFEFIVDGEVDNVYGIAITGNRSGSNSTFVVTSPEGEILGIPPSLAAVEGINFDGAGAGTCLIWHLRYEDGLEGLEMGLNTNDLNGCYDFSNYIEVVRKDAISGGMLSGGPSFEFCVGDEEADHVSGVTVSGNTGSNSRWVVTSPEGKILGLPPTPEAVNFDGAGAGTCLIWHLSHEDGLTGLEVGNYVADLYGTYDFSDYISVYRSQPDAGELTGGPFEFIVDGEVDNVYGIAITGNRSGSNSTFVVTSPEGEILGIPPSLAAVEGINFDGAGAGTCLIWHLRYEDGLEGLEMGLNTNDLNGCYDFSNYIEVVRADAISGKIGAKLFPMPASDVLNVSLGSFGGRDVQVTMIDLAGNAVKNKTQQVIDQKVSLNVQSIPSGMYILKISNAEGKSIAKKVIIQ